VFDYIVCAHKAISAATVPPIFKAGVNGGTTFVIIQNGVGNEAPFREVKSEDMQIGLFPNPSIPAEIEKARLEGFAALLRAGGTVFQVEDDIQIKRWEKVVWNAAWNPITALTDVTTHKWLKSSEEAMPTTRRLMREVIDVARRCDVPLGYDLIDKLIDRIQAMHAIYSSMHTDAKEGRPLEIDPILGYPMRKAREFGMDVPTLSTIYSLTAAANERLTTSKL